MSIYKFIYRYFNWDVSGFLKSKNINGQKDYVFVKNAEYYRIPTYPRFLINNLSIKKEAFRVTSFFDRPTNKQNVFNSSDFLLVNIAFGSIKPNFGQTLKIGGTLRFYDKDYKIVNIKVTIADYFNDYSFTAYETSIVNEGKSIPYNIVIEVDVEDI